ncbi:MAG TPA: hypothetical protein VKV03_14460 [Candidatus Binataceae bacterium]|nr:hypothetical protein [Candidatus Binataceae bacterium]
MKRAARLASISVASIALFTILQGCGSNSAQNPSPSAPAPDAPHEVTDLSQVGPGSAIDPFGKKEQNIARRVASDDEVAPNSIDLGALANVRHTGDDKHPCEQRLLNKKAAQFDMVSVHLLDQVFSQIRRLQGDDEFSHVVLPTDLRWVVITATINHQGALKELVIEQHSGTAAMDKLMVAACKKGLYLRNAPEDAADPSGNYKVRIEARMENFASLDGEHWEYKTYMGLAIL